MYTMCIQYNTILYIVYSIVCIVYTVLHIVCININRQCIFITYLFIILLNIHYCIKRPHIIFLWVLPIFREIFKQGSHPYPLYICLYIANHPLRLLTIWVITKWDILKSVYSPFHTHQFVCFYLNTTPLLQKILKHSFSLFRSPLLHLPLAVTFLFLAGTPKKERYHYGHLSYSSLTLSTQFLTRHTYQLRLPDSQAYHLKH